MTTSYTSTPGALHYCTNNHADPPPDRMPLEPHNGNWDFAAAIDLIRSVQSPRQSSIDKSTTANTPLSSNDLLNGRVVASSLGNFDAIFSALGLPLENHLTSSILLPPAPELSQATSSTQTAHKATKKRKTRPTKRQAQDVEQAEKTSDDDVEVESADAEGLIRVQADMERLIQAEEDSMDTIVEEHAFLECANEKSTAELTTKRSENRLESQDRRVIISSVVGRTATKATDIGKKLSGVAKSYLTPASVKPLTHTRTCRDDTDFSPSPLGSDKLIRLTEMLFQHFPDDSSSLSTLYSPLSALECNQKFPHGLHVFIDISNILIGFHDTLKARRGLRKDFRLPRQRMSFQKLALVLERGRPTAKRELVGSDRLESIIEAESIGYKTHILERVSKIKELTQRQKFFMKLDGKSGASSGSEAEYARATQARRVEQGVDEILHLKMSHSLLDTSTPSTIVLATGDAAEAEYSDGFLAMVERALERKWKVELVAFKGNMSRAYRHEDWTSRWGASFKIIELDDYAELLHLE